MGKDWHWSRSSRKAHGNTGEKHRRRGHQHHIVGCMSGVLHLFDLHQLLFATRNVVADPDPVPLAPASKFPDHPHWKEHIRKGVEAPRNSLEIDVTTAAAPSPAASAFGVHDEYEIPFGVQVVPKRKSDSLEEQMKERSLQVLSSAGRSNGNVVAKLMGLDSLPNEQGFSSFSPRTYCYREESLPPAPVIGYYEKQQWQSNKNKKKQRKVECSSLRGSRTPPARHPLQPTGSNVMVEEDGRRGTRSLPETPRMSMARSSWDSDPRLSVQSSCGTGNRCGNNKENLVCGVANMSAFSMQELRCAFEDHSSVSPSSPLFPTTKTRSRTSGSKQRNLEESGSGSSRYAKEIVRQTKDSVCRRIERGRLAKTTDTTTSTSSRTPTSSSPSTPRRIEMVEHGIHSRVNVKAPAPPKQASVKPMIATMPRPEIPSPAAPTTKCKKRFYDRFNERLKKPPCATPAISNATPVPSGLPQRKSTRTNEAPSPSQPSPPKIDIQAVKPLCPKHGREVGIPPPVPEELQYVKRVLEKAGICGQTSLPFAVRWNFPSHPLDPIIFHELELIHTINDGPLRHRCNRKLLFDLVDEILGDLLYPYLSNKAWWGKRTAKPTKILDGESVLRQLWSTVRSFPAADCQVMQDIDALVESDIPASNVRRLLRHLAVQEESEMIAVEVERWLVDTLLVENASLPCTWHE